MDSWRYLHAKEGRMRRRVTIVSRVVICVFLLGCSFGAAVASASPIDAHVRAQLPGLRMPFIVNQGQIDRRVAYYASTFAGTLFVTQEGQLVYSVLAGTADGAQRRRQPSSRSSWTLTETFAAGRPCPTGQDSSMTGVSYFLGRDAARWRSQVPTYEEVRLGEVWPGITVSLRAHGRNIEKVFTVSPGASVNRLRVRVAGANALSVNSAGALVAGTGLGDVLFTVPRAYQERDGVRHDVAIAYRLRGREYGFSVAAYDRRLPLTIDPLLQSTYLGGTGADSAMALAVHPTTGDIYVAGATGSSDFPGTVGGAQAFIRSSGDAFIARLNSSLTALRQATYLGGSGGSGASALAVHPTTGDIYVAGTTASTDFPGTAGGAQPAFGGGFLDAFIARLPSSLTALTQATYLGGGGHEMTATAVTLDSATAIAIDSTTGDVYVAGITSSTDFPGTVGGAQPAFSGGVSDAFIARLPSSLTALTQATYLGGPASNRAGGDDLGVLSSIAIHSTTGDVYVSGRTSSLDFPGTVGGAQPAFGGGRTDGFIARLSASLTLLIQATYLGGSGEDEVDSAMAIHPATGDVYVGGRTTSTQFPGTRGGAQPALRGIQDGFVARLNSGLTALTQATYLGGSGLDEAHALAINPKTNDIYVAGETNSTDFPGTVGGAQPAFGGGGFDAFIARLAADLTVITQATYLGGGGYEVVVALAINVTNNDIYAVGGTSSPDFPGTSGGAQPVLRGGCDRFHAECDAFIARLTYSLAAVDPALGLSATVNQPTFTVGQTLSAGGAVTDPGLPVSADFYVGILRPDGSIQFFTDAGIVLGNVPDVRSFRPLAVGVPLGTPFAVNAPNFYTHQWAAGDPHGDYVFFVAAVKTGALDAGTLPSDQILGLATTSFSFP